MKQSIIPAFAILITFQGTSFSQTIQGGTFEGSISAAYGSASLVGNVTSPFILVSMKAKPVRYFSSFVRAGYFVTRAIEGEVELHWWTMSNSSPIGIYTLNASLNIPIRGSRFVPFLLLGGGFAAGVPPLFGADQGHHPHCGVVNIGVGLKYLIADHLALRTEYRFQQLSAFESLQTNSSTYFSSITINHENVLLGVSVLF